MGTERPRSYGGRWGGFAGDYEELELKELQTEALCEGVPLMNKGRFYPFRSSVVKGRSCRSYAAKTIHWLSLLEQQPMEYWLSLLKSSTKESECDLPLSLTVDSHI